MDPLNSHNRDIAQQVAILSVRHDLLQRLWPEQKRISELFVAAIEILDKDPQNRTAHDFLTGVISLLRRPADLIDLCDALSTKDLRHLALELFTFSPVADGDLIAALVSDLATFARLDQNGVEWVGRTLLRRAMILCQDFPDRKF